MNIHRTHPIFTFFSIPRLCGVIRSGNHSILEILITNITPNLEAPRLGLIDVNTVTIARRKKWASQIKATIEKVHDVGVVGDNTKAYDILIDKNDDTWIIDFGMGEVGGRGSTQNERIV